MESFSGFHVVVFMILLILFAMSIFSLCYQSTDESHPEIIKMFDLRKNLNTLMDNPVRKLSFFDGIRALSLFWVIFGHEYFVR